MHVQGGLVKINDFERNRPCRSQRASEICRPTGRRRRPRCIHGSVGGLPAAVAGDLHTCPVVSGVVAHASTPFLAGSATVLVGGRPALRAGDLCACGAPIAGGAANVLIGG